jgi:hypothetical protein
MEIDRDLIQDVIDRIIKYGQDYANELRTLNKKHPVEYKIVGERRTYPPPSVTSENEETDALGHDENNDTKKHIKKKAK